MAIKINANTAPVLEDMITKMKDVLDRGEASEPGYDLGKLVTHISALTIVNAEITLALLNERHDTSIV